MDFSREFMKCDIYPKDDKRKYTEIAGYINRAMENILWLGSYMGGCNPTLENHEKISVLEQLCKIADATYPKFDCCVCHSSMADICLLLFRFYSEEERYDEALGALRMAFMHEKAIDEIEDSVVRQTSPLFDGYEFDMRKTYNGCKCNGVWWLFERLDEAAFQFEYYKSSRAYAEILDEYRKYAVEDRTKAWRL